MSEKMRERCRYELTLENIAYKTIIDWEKNIFRLDMCERENILSLFFSSFFFK